MIKEDLRPIEIILKENREEKKVKGYFLGWNHIIIRNGKQAMTLAICELEDGTVIEVCCTKIKFMDRE